MLAGVVGGIARRFGWNSNLLRLVYVLVSILSAGFPGILAYLILWLLIPEEGALPRTSRGRARRFCWAHCGHRPIPSPA